MIGRTIGSHEVVAKLGEGGMGEVYRATDARLKRQVAIKVLPASVAADVDRLARFQREAEVLASLNHPNIAGIYGLEETGGTTALVMELVEGPTLAELLARAAQAEAGGARGLSLDEALPIARQIAEALEGAHDHGIIHRDLKPANIKIRPDGVVKVLDFGLAKAMDPAGASSADAMHSPTLTARATQAGMILGTAAYMAPEQARGKLVDRRADIWAFGAVLFEMLTGTRAFPGEDITDTLAAVVRAEPQWDLLPRDVPPTLRVYLRRCLEKDPKQRVGDIRDVRLALEGALDVALQPAAVTSTPAPRARLAWTIAAVSILAATALAIPALRHLREAPPSTPPEIRTDIVTSGTGDFALSPDGRQLAFVAASGGMPRLWLRSLSDHTAQLLMGTEGTETPFWSPDNRSVAFVTGTAMKRLDLGGGAPRTIATSADRRFISATWGADDVILYSHGGLRSGLSDGLARIPAAGGTPTPLSPLGPEMNYFGPSFLPDGRRFLFTALGRPDVAGIYLGTLDSRPPVRLTTDVGRALFLAAPGASGDGWLLWGRSGALTAQRLDLAKPALAGEPVSLAADGEFASTSSTGLIAYRAGNANAPLQFAWFDARGDQLETVGEPGSLFEFDVSPDGKSVAMSVRSADAADIWILEAARGLRTRFTFTQATHRTPVWSPDGRSLAFASSSRAGQQDLYRKSVDGAVGSEELLYSDDREKRPDSWSADGKYLLFGRNDPQTKSDLWILPLTGERKPFPFARTEFSEIQGTFSPDGRWIAYVSDESGSAEVYVAPFPGPGGKHLISTRQAGTGQGGVPVWRRDGKEIFYIAPDRNLMAVAITTNGSTIEAGLPRVLFGPILAVGGRNYAVSADGKRFLTYTRPGLRTNVPITLIQNWQPGRMAAAPR
jgi:serine/threonine protein kinase/Tol biopolymer transport system component